MPRRKFIKRKKNTNKRKFNRRVRKRGLKMSHVMVRGPTAVPDYIDIKLRYIEVGAKTAGGVTMSQAIYSGNSLFSPAVSGGYGTSHQPISFDQWSALYRTYFVKASAIKLSFVVSAPCAIAVLPCQSVSVPSSIPATFEAARAKSMIASSTNGRTSLRHYMSTATIYGLRNLSNDDANYVAISSSDPSNNWYWTINYQDPDGSTNLHVDMKVEIIYYVRLFNRINLATS